MTTTTKTTTEQISPDRWIPFTAEFTRENRGAHARLDVLHDDIGDQVMTDDRPFEGISVDAKDGERAVWITFGGLSKDHLTHGVQNVAAVYFRPPTVTTGAALEIEAHDGTKTILQLTRPEVFALPPAS